MTKNTKPTELNDLFNLSLIKKEIAKQHGSIYKYCKEHDINEGNMSNFLNKGKPITLKELHKHCNNLKLYITVKVSR